MQNQKPSKKMVILQRPFTLDKSVVHSNQEVSSADSPSSVKFSVKLNVIMISAVVYHSFFRRYHKNKDYDFFFMSLYDVNKVLDYIEPRMSIRFMPEVKEGFTQKITLKKVDRLLFAEFKDLFQDFDLSLAEKLSSHRAYDHKIELEGDSRTIKSRVYSMSYHKLLELKKYLDENLKKGFITASSAFFASFVLFVTKSNGSLRFCVDYRKLNAIIKRNRYLISLIEETLAKVIDFKYLIKLNIIAVFNKLRMNSDSENFTTFITSLNFYKYKVLPFGLINGPANYQHYMNDVLWNYINDFVQCYLNDILIYSKIRKVHVKHVKMILERLREADLQMDIIKSEFFVKETTFLGVIVSTNGIRMNFKKIQVIVDWMTSINLKEVQAFLGFCNFYRRFIRNFAKIVKCMNKLAMKNAPFQWTDVCDKAFQLLKKAITTASMLRHFDRSKEIILKIDVFDYINDEVLSQYDDEEILHFVTFFNKNMMPTECNYEIYDIKLLIIIRCLKHWRLELKFTDIPMKIFSDHKALKTFMTSKNLTRRQARWAEILSEYNFKIMYQSGPRNVKAKVLTRLPESIPKSEDDARIKQQHQVILTSDRLEIRVMKVDSDLSLYSRVMKANKASDECFEYRIALAQGKKEFKRVKLASCTVKHEILYFGSRVWVPGDVQLLVDLIRESHDSFMCGHSGALRTLQIIGRYYYWPNMKITVGQYIRNCHTCRRSKASNDRYNGFLVPSPVSAERWQDIFMDFITGLFDSHGHNAICIMIDKLSKERHYALCTAKDEGTFAEATVKILVQYVFRTHDLFTSITFDRDPQFVAFVWKFFCRRLGIQCNLFTAWHFETDGQSEIANKKVETHLRQYCAYMQDDWSEWLLMAEFADNNKLFAVIGMSSFFVNKSFNSRMIIGSDEIFYEFTRERFLIVKAEDITGIMTNILKLMQGNLQQFKQVMTTQVNKHRKLIKYNFEDRVWLFSNNIIIVRSFRKLEDKMLKPFEIVKAIGTFYKLKLPIFIKVHPVFHISLLRSDFNDSLLDQITDASKSMKIANEDEWLMNDILNSRRHYGRLQYKIKWNGFKRNDDWYNIDRGEFTNSQKVVDAFHSQYLQKAESIATRTLRSKGKFT